MTPSAPARILDGALRAYQLFLSPVLPGACRFHPTCSRYAREAVRLHGARRGLWLAVRRLLRCHPFHPGGYDPVPPGPGATRPEDTPAARGSA
ncbi:membrane protein insertion efficiency factor YidD [Dissulfurirhabdus thermomarina]|uniref:Putative membrane protein insertion efficiency factor n=1 Tax=Dissulfurirhabdus thermomarina TaxID=1765737 RepID=A0A6N9TUF5_DISTH|nr:membrane protein insertion efficiency factor YidD [Dissulfurirhabdus thermomarina]NDY43364.1 membrane protein insertion efficiency factor YidD [Dissulfurirhabdus thermomarina]NMX23413.1 membrane protein insertion efficiency factor YidD [Dissulfurirhabdus thermomarina]